ncbi:MAG TPA: mycothiol synthase [Mycobacteriales bacterium]|jgi:mycothiol synthase|nr:mycothiol synthase [Mycobacteriales bacterium]
MTASPQDLIDLIAAAERADGVRPVSEQTELAVRAGAPAETVSHAGRVAGFAYAADDSAELVVAPELRRQGVGTALLAALRDAGTADRIWAHGRISAAQAFADHHGYLAERVLWQMRRPAGALPAAALPADVELRPFVPGQDEQAWLAVNARSFAHHPDQGRMTLADLQAREAEPWFDPAGFLLAFRGGVLIGFHWTKIHPDGMGEIYVLGLDPAAQGMRLSTPLAIAGLRSLAERGAPESLLYVDESNAAAKHLYEKLGYHEFRADVQFVPKK